MGVLYVTCYFDNFLISFDSNTIEIWLVLLLIGKAEPRARGRRRFKVEPLFTVISLITRLSFSRLKLVLALSTADFKSLEITSAAFLSANCNATIT